MRRGAATMLVCAACTSQRAPEDSAVDVADVPDVLSVDAARSDAPNEMSDVPTVTLPPSSRTLSDLVGISGFLRGGSDAASVAQRRYVYRKLHQIGIHRLRCDFTWSEIEPSRGVYDFSAYDTRVTEAAAAGIDLLPILDYGNSWASSAVGATNSNPPDDPQTFASFASQTAAHFAGRLHQYEIWNEPNVGFRFWPPTVSGDPVAFGHLVLASANAIEPVGGGAIVASGGTAYLPEFVTGGVQFAQETFAATPGLASALGGFAFHAYDYYVPARPPESDAPNEVPLLEKFARTATMLHAAGFDLRKPLWLTEIGWPTTALVSEAQQASYLVRSVLLSAFAGADAVYLYTLSDGPMPQAVPPEDAFGIAAYDPDYANGPDPADKPALTDLAALESIFGAYRVVDRVTPADAPTDAFVFHLSDGTHDAWAAWRVGPSTEPYPWTVPVGATNVRVFSIDGSALAFNTTSRAVTLDVNPVYVLAGVP